MSNKFSINASLTEDLCTFVDGQVASGRFGTSSEVVRAALRALQRELGQVEAPNRGDDAGVRPFERPVAAGMAHRTVETRDRQILNSAIDYAIISLDLQGRVTSWNEGARRILGWTEAEMLGQPADRFFTPEDVAINRAATEMADALRTGRGNDERWHLRQDTSRFWAAGEMMVLRDDAGTATGFIKLLRDRTQQRQAVRALRHGQERVETALDTGLLGFFDWNVAKDLICGDARFAEFHGLDHDRLTKGMPLQELSQLIHPEDRAAVAETVQAAAASASTYTVQFRTMHPGGETRYLLIRGRCYEQDENHGLHFTGVAIDITAAKQAEEALRASEEFNRRLLASSSDCIKVLDRQGHLSFMSEGGLKVMEVDDFATIVGRPFLEFWSGPWQGAAIGAIETARAGGVGRFEGDADTVKGTPRHWNVVVTPIFGSGHRPERLLAVSRDITATHRAEQAVRRSEAHWRGLFEKLREGFILAELVRGPDRAVTDWRYLDVNPAWGDLIGVSPEAATGRTIRELFPTIEESWIKQMEGVVETGEASTFTRQVGGLGRWYEGHAFPLTGDQFAVLFLEVTERKQIEARQLAMVDLGDRLRDMDDPAEMSFLAAEIIGCTLGVSRAGYGTILPGSEELLVKRDWTAPGMTSAAGQHQTRDYGSWIDDLRRGEAVVVADIHQETYTYQNTAALEAVATRAFVALPLLEQDRLAALLFVSNVEPRRWSGEELGFMRDVVERTWAAMERRRAEQRLRELADSLEQQVEERTRERDRLWRLSRDPFLIADEEGRWLNVNPAWTEILGWSENELIGRTSEWIEHPDDRGRKPAEVDALAARSIAQKFESRFRSRNGTYRWFSWTAAPAGGLVYCVARDVTEEKDAAEMRTRLEDQLRQSQKMEAVGQLTGGLAHDFNNLLTGITGSLELLQTRVAQGRIKDVDRYVSAAQGAAKRAAALTHRLLAFSRRQTLDPKPTDVNRLVAGMEELVRRTVGPAIAVEAVTTGGLWNTLVDPSQLENALLNLCINARDAMPGGGRLMIEIGNKEMDTPAARECELSPGQYVTLCVSDNGTGMPPQVVARAFDPFFTTKPIGQGTGLGLSMIYGFARQSGGQVRITSEPEQGTVVCLYLPRHHGAAEEVTPAPELFDAPRAGRDETVLIVDDEPTVRMLVTEVLEDLGYTAIEAADGAAGLKVLRSDVRIDLLVTDVGLPGGMNGRQVADGGRVLRPELKVLFITGYAENAVLSHGHLEPGMHVLTKPFAMEALASRIKDLIAGN